MEQVCKCEGFHLSKNAAVYACETQLDVEILSFKYPHKNDFCLSRKNIMQRGYRGYQDIARSNENRFFCNMEFILP